MEELVQKIQTNGLNYTLVGDYYIPDLLPPEENRPIGRWGRLRKHYLEESHPIRYNRLVLSGELWTYLADLNEQVQNRLELVIEQMQHVEGVTEALKAQDQMEWVRQMNNIRNRAEEIVKTELIFA